ncbi:MAG: heavy metal-binding domain-containing protein [Bacteroidota bacterium]
MKSISLMGLVLSLGLFFAACGGEATEAAAHGEGKEYTSAYVCPMHCEGSGAEEAGTCPACGMDYIAQAEHTSDGHSH